MNSLKAAEKSVLFIIFFLPFFVWFIVFKGRSRSAGGKADGWGNIKILYGLLNTWCVVYWHCIWSMDPTHGLFGRWKYNTATWLKGCISLFHFYVLKFFWNVGMWSLLWMLSVFVNGARVRLHYFHCFAMLLPFLARIKQQEGGNDIFFAL